MSSGKTRPAEASPIRSRYLRPHPALRAWISHYWELQGAIDPAEPRSFQRLLPGINAAFIFQLAAPVDVRSTQHSWQARPASFAEGHFHEPFHLRFTGRFRLAGISFLPGRIHPFICDSQAEINNRFVDLGLVLGSVGRTLHERLQECATLEALASVFDTHMLTLRPKSEPDDRGLNEAMRLAVSKPTAANVIAMARAACLSPRQLERRFKDTVGLSPKYFCQVARFDYFLRHWHVQPDLLLTSLAHECGYFDQAHLNHEFKRFTGESPTAYLDRDHAVEAALSQLHLAAST